MHGAPTVLRPLVVAVVAALALAACGSTDSDDVLPAGTIETSGDLPTFTAARIETELLDVMDRFEVPGAVVAVATPDGSWVAEAGVADLDTEEPVSADMVWPLRSITKSVIVTVVLQLADDGLLDLTDPVDEHVDGVPAGDRMTLGELADMTSGVGDYTRSSEFVEALVADTERIFTLEELNDYGFALGPQFDPGDDRAYSNTAPNVLGSVVEAVTGEPVDGVVHARILQPLGLDDTTYPEAADQWPGPHAQGYQPSDGEMDATFNNFSSMGASGSMLSTLDDTAVWVEALVTGELVSEELQEARFDAGPLSEGPEYDRYGMGVGELDGWWGHTGEGLGFTSLAMHHPDTGSTVVVFMNVSQALDDEGEERHPPTVLMREIAALLDE